MTGASPVLDRPALRAALSGMRIEADPGTGFEAELAARQGWNPRFAGRVADEYRRFLYLAAVAGAEVTPSQFVDEAWHLHLEMPHYREILCGRILGRPLEHRPGTGTAEDDARCARQYEQTLALYERLFGEPAPDDIWPRPFEPEEDAPRIGRGRIGAAAGAVAALAAPAAGTSALAPVLIIGAAIVGLILFPMDILTGVGSRRKGAGCGGGCGAGGGGSSSCCASCGGGCGGGCGGD